MLDRLPNELIVKILEKTNMETRRKARMLNRHFNELIVRYDLHKESLLELKISPTKWGWVQSEGHDLCFKSETMEKKITFQSYEELLEAFPNYAKSIKNVATLDLTCVEINHTLMEILQSYDCVRSIISLHIKFCNVDADVVHKWFNYLGRLRLKHLHISFPSVGIPGKVPIPPTILNNVEEIFEYNKFPFVKFTTTDMKWLTDEVLEKWFKPTKIVSIPDCVTGLTIDGIITCIQKSAPLRELLEAHGYQDELDLGMLNNTRQSEVVRAFKKHNVKYTKTTSFNGKYKSYEIESIGNKETVGGFNMLTQPYDE